MKKKIAIVAGGDSSEYEVSLVSSYGVLTNVNREIFDVTAIGITREGKWFLFEDDIDLIPDNRWITGKCTPAAISTDFGEKCINVFRSEGMEKIAIDAVFPVLEAHQQGRCHCRYGQRCRHGFPVEAGHQQAGRRIRHLRAAARLHLLRHGSCQDLNIGFGEFLTDDGSPATGTKLNHISFSFQKQRAGSLPPAENQALAVNCASHHASASASLVKSLLMTFHSPLLQALAIICSLLLARVMLSPLVLYSSP